MSEVKLRTAKKLPKFRQKIFEEMCLVGIHMGVSADSELFYNASGYPGQCMVMPGQKAYVDKNPNPIRVTPDFKFSLEDAAKRNWVGRSLQGVYRDGSGGIVAYRWLAQSMRHGAGEERKFIGTLKGLDAPRAVVSECCALEVYMHMWARAGVERYVDAKWPRMGLLELSRACREFGYRGHVPLLMPDVAETLEQAIEITKELQLAVGDQINATEYVARAAGHYLKASRETLDHEGLRKDPVSMSHATVLRTYIDGVCPHVSGGVTTGRLLRLAYEFRDQLASSFFDEFPRLLDTFRAFDAHRELAALPDSGSTPSLV